MSDERLIGAYRLLARLFGIGMSVGGLFLLPSAPILGVPLLAVGLLFALRPVTAGELLDIAASLA